MPRKLLLLLFAISIESINDQVFFQTLPIGSQFTPTRSSEFLLQHDSISSVMQCLRKCFDDLRCRTVNFDSTTCQCSLFSAWNFEGNLSSSPTSQVAFVPQQSTLYTAYLQSCTPSINSLNRYLRCVNNTWICPDRYFFNGNVCEAWRSFNQPCLLDEWCDATKYLLCSNVSRECRCNSSMSWDGSICVSVCPSGQSGISFDDLQVWSLIPSGYGGFQWSNVQVWNDTLRAPYGPQYLYNINPSPVNISRINGTFTLYSMQIPKLLIPTLNVTVTLLKMGTVVTTGWYRLNNTRAWKIIYNISNIEMISFSFSPLMAMALSIDNLCFSV